MIALRDNFKVEAVEFIYLFIHLIKNFSFLIVVRNRTFTISSMLSV